MNKSQLIKEHLSKLSAYELLKYRPLRRALTSAHNRTLNKCSELFEALAHYFH
jgi:hypothetical protein